MDGDVSTSQPDQISLYGLFGDSSATLQGLNDHLSPSLLQRSPPCGSVLGAQPALTKVVTSPNKVVFNGAQQGVLLSDLADRSPSAGSVTVASLCSYVSFDNLRCTNLVTRKGNRFCGQHSKQGVERPVPSTNLKKTVSFTPLTQLKSGSSISVNTGAPSTMKAVKLDVKSLAPGGMKPKSVVIQDTANSTLKAQQNQVCFVRKVGQQITVTARPIGMKNTDTNTKSVGTGSTEISPIKTVTAAESTVKPKSRMVMKTGNSGTSSAKVTPRATQTPVSNVKPNGMDEDVLKKVVGVLNSRNDLTSQQQISLLQSMGITVVHGSPAIAKNLTVRKKKPSKPVVRRVITIGNAKNIPTAVSPFKSPSGVPPLIHGINQFHSRLANGSQNSSALSPIRPLPSAMETVARQAALGGHIPISKSKVDSSLTVNGSSATVMESLAWQAVRNPQVPDPSKKDAKGHGKVAQKRKEKLTGGSSAKKSKPAPEKLPQGQTDIHTLNTAKKSKLSRPSTDKVRQQKRNVRGKPASSSFFIACPPPKRLQAPAGSSPYVHHLVQHLNEKALLDHSLFESESIESGEKLEADKNKTLKSKLLKQYLVQKRIQSIGAFNYKQYFKDLKGTDFCKAFAAAKTLLDLLQRQSQGRKTVVHHEKILQAVLEKDDPEYKGSLEEDVLVPCNRAFTDDHDLDEVTAFTLQTVHIKNEYTELVRQLDAEEKELKLLMECYNDDCLSTVKLLNAMTQSKPDKPKRHFPRKCHLSSDHGLSCDDPALPFSSYCRQHIWYCQSQCLYKLDQNMKPIADVSPEPLVKKVRKRTKLLPLIKRYKKKKRRKIEGSDGSNPDKEVLKKNDVVVTKLQVAGSSTQSNVHMQSQPIRDALLGENTKTVKIDDSDLEDTKPSDSDDEDLNLTNEIMLSGVLDKLPDDPHDFDLFTTDKGAEELERALLLAATSPSPDHDENDIDFPDYQNSAGLLSNAKLDGSPSAIINCDAPKSNEHPPSLESFNKSQCVHYTFGSNLPGIAVSKNETETNELEVGDEVVPPLISAEDLKDIEGVLERLHAEDVNSPKLPSSPAVDQYTSMLARQLSQEVETESLKQLSSSNDLANVRKTFPSLKEPATTLSRSYSLPTSSIHNIYSAGKTDIVNGLVSLGNELKQSGVVHNVTALCSTSETSSSTSDGKNTMSLQKSLSSNPQPAVLSQRPITKMPTTQVVSNARNVSAIDLPSMQVSTKPVKEVAATASAMKVSNQGSIPVSPRTSQPKTSQSPTVVSSPVLPVTLMQSPSQSGNVIKVIVPPGTMVNGTNGQQNMLLIPVSALMKQNALQASQNIPSSLIPGISNQSSTSNVRTQLSNLQTGQQFFIVNNNTGSAQTHLALVQKPVTGSSQQPGVFVKPSPKPVTLQKDEICKQHFGNRIQCNTKLNLNDRLKQNQVSKQQVFPSSLDVGSVTGSKSPDIKSSAAYGTSDVSQAVSTMSNQIGRPSMQTGNGRRVKNPVKKVKAKFDPVAKRYVSSTSIAAGTSVPPPVTTSFATSADPNLSENLKKFNASALSIQSKVQQIDSVLLSLNAAKNSQPVGKQPNNSNTEKKVKALRSTISSVDKAPISNQSPYIPVQATMTAIGSTLPQNSATPVLPKASTDASPKEKQAKRQKAANGKQNKSTPKKVGTVNTSVSNKVSESISASSVPVSSGTVHWNQTTTAGPEVTTTTLTVPVYITGAIPAGTWPGDLALKGSLAGASLPVILPAHKISPHCQIPQRVLLGSIGSLAVRSQVVTVASSASNIKPTRTIITPVTMPLNGGTVLQTQASNSTGIRVQQSSFPVVKTAEGEVSSQLKVTLQNPKAQPAVKPSAHEDAVTKKKPGRKANHSNILHDPLMYDPTASDGSLPNVS